ncbi:hypothetical protein Tco_0694743 [Tanacetum coccineum]
MGRSWTPLAGFDKEKKKRRKRKDFDPSIETDQSSSSPKGTTQSSLSLYGKLYQQRNDLYECAIENESNQEDVEVLKMMWYEPCANDRPEQSWFLELVNFEQNQAKFNDLIGFDFLTSPVCPCNHLHERQDHKVDLVRLGDSKREIDPSPIEKPLPLQDKDGRLTIPVEFFFNNDLECLKTGNTKRKYTILMTKIKAAKYDLVGIEEMIQAYGA